VSIENSFERAAKATVMWFEDNTYAWKYNTIYVHYPLGDKTTGRLTIAMTKYHDVTENGDMEQILVLQRLDASVPGHAALIRYLDHLEPLMAGKVIMIQSILDKRLDNFFERLGYELRGIDCRWKRIPKMEDKP
jgi:hypothetical protein